MNISQIYFFGIQQNNGGMIMEIEGADKRKSLFEIYI